MFLQPEFYLHIITGNACDAAPLLARIALHFGYDALAYPVRLDEIRSIKRYLTSSDGAMLSVLLVSDFLKASMLEGVKPWGADQVKQLKVFAASTIFSPIEYVDHRLNA
jgi:hypothetical protein